MLLMRVMWFILIRRLVQFSKDDVDETCITAYSYDIEKRVDFITMKGGDGYYHDVPVEWDEYLPLEQQNYFFVGKYEEKCGEEVLATRNGLCIYKL